MKTTLDLADDLHARAKLVAAQLKIPLTRLIEQALRERLDDPRVRPEREPIETRTFRLGLKPAYRGVNFNHLAAELDD